MAESTATPYEVRRIYPENEKEQERALESDPFLAECRKIREAEKADRYRPIYHFTRPSGYLNDPNGICFWKGKWHLFYQAATDKGINWGHAVTEDFKTFRDLPYAIYPKYEDHCFSGAVVIDEENERAIAVNYGYTGYDDKTGYRCGIVLSVSTDPLLLNWTKVNGGLPIIPDKDAPCWRAPDAEAVPDQKPYKVFDPYIWKEDGVLYLLTAGYTPNASTGRRFREMYLFKCTDKELFKWEYVKPFLTEDKFSEAGDDGACPYFLNLGKKRLMLHFSHRAVPKYIVGDYDKETQTFYPTNGERITSGNGVLVAPSAYAVGESAVGLFNTAEQLSHGNSYGCMTLPMSFSVGGYWNDKIAMKPLCDYSDRYLSEKSFSDIKLRDSETYILEDVRGDSYELRLKLLSENIPQSFEIEVLRSENAEETTKISFFKEQGGMYAILPYTTDSVIMLDTTKASENSAVKLQPPEVKSFEKQADEDLDIRVFVDKSIVEVFVNSKTYLIKRAYPKREDSVGISLRALGRDTVVSELKFGRLGSIWE